MAVVFRGRVRRWREDKPGGLAVVDVPSEQVAALGGRRQIRVTGTPGEQPTAFVVPQRLDVDAGPFGDLAGTQPGGLRGHEAVSPVRAGHGSVPATDAARRANDSSTSVYAAGPVNTIRT